jgi:hypothetical protein
MLEPSFSIALGDCKAFDESLEADRGGGSMDALFEDDTTGSGSEVNVSSTDDVSRVMWLVGFGPCLRAKKIGEHLTATDGFLCPGRCAIGGLLKPARV